MGGPGCQALSRAQGSIGVPPVFSIRVQDDDQKLAGRTLPRSHEPICSRHSAAQARRLCYHRLGVMPPLRPNSRGTSCQATIAPSLRGISQHALTRATVRQGFRTFRNRLDNQGCFRHRNISNCANEKCTKPCQEEAHPTAPSLPLASYPNSVFCHSNGKKPQL